MRTRKTTQIAISLLLVSAFPLILCAQTVDRTPSQKKHESENNVRVPDLSGSWQVMGGAPSWDPSDPRGAKPEGLPMTPWALAKFKAARPPFGANATFEAVNDPVQKYCDPPGITRLYNYPWNFAFIQTPSVVYILYEFTGLWRPIAMDREHPKNPDSTWMGDSIGKYESDAFVIDTIGFNDKTWIDQVGHPHSDALHLIERFHRVDQDTLELSVTFDDLKAYAKQFTATRVFKRSSAPMEETVCSLSEMQSFDDDVMKTTTEKPQK